MDVAGAMSGFSRVVLKLSMTFLVFSVVVLLWLRPEGASFWMMIVIIAINTVTMLLSLLCLLVAARKERKGERRPSILEVLDRKKQEETNE